MVCESDADEEEHRVLRQDEMSDATHTLPQGGDDAAFGRCYAARGDATPEFHMPPGWWLLPAVIGGAAGWIALISAIFF